MTKCAVVVQDFYEGDNDFVIMLLEPNEQDLLKLHQTQETKIGVQQLQYKLNLTQENETLVLTEDLYEEIYGTSIEQDKEADIMEEEVFKVQTVGHNRGQKRQTRVPSYLCDYV